MSKTWIDLLRAGNLSALDDGLNRVQADFEAGRIPESTLFERFVNSTTTTK